MAPVIWGLDLAEITWAKFGNANMWNNKYHLRRTKIIFYQLAMIFCVVSESLGTAALSNYVDQQNFIQNLNNNALEYNDDYVGVASYNIFSGIFLAFVFGAAFFFDLIWPERHEDQGIRWAWKLCAIAAAVFEVASAFALTIITATRSANVQGVGSDEATRLLEMFGGSPLEYKRNGRAVAAVVFVWPGAIFTVISAIVLWMSYAHDDKFGDPYSTHYREELRLGGNGVDREAAFINRTEDSAQEEDLEKNSTDTRNYPMATLPQTSIAGTHGKQTNGQEMPRVPEPAHYQIPAEAV